MKGLSSHVLCATIQPSSFTNRTVLKINGTEVVGVRVREH